MLDIYLTVESCTQEVSYRVLMETHSNILHALQLKCDEHRMLRYGAVFANCMKHMRSDDTHVALQALQSTLTAPPV